MTTPITPIRTSPEQRYRVLVRNEHRVGEHVHLLSNTTRPELVEHVLESFIRHAPPGEVVEVQGFGGYELKLAVDTCAQCGGLGWLHEVSGAGDVVLACGHWGTFNHEHARVKHDGDCGCAWGKVTVGVDVALGADETRYSHVDGDGRVERVLRLLTRTDAEILGAGVVSRSCAMFYACSECVAEVCSCSCHKAAALKRLPAVPLSLPKPDHEEAAAQERRAEAWRHERERENTDDEESASS